MAVTLFKSYRCKTLLIGLTGVVRSSKWIAQGETSGGTSAMGDVFVHGRGHFGGEPPPVLYEGIPMALVCKIYGLCLGVSASLLEVTSQRLLQHYCENFYVHKYPIRPFLSWCTHPRPHFSVPPYYVRFLLRTLLDASITTFYYWDYYTVKGTLVCG